MGKPAGYGNKRGFFASFVVILTGGVVFFLSESSEPQKTMVFITLLVLGFSAVTDLYQRLIYILPVYCALASCAVLVLAGAYSDGQGFPFARTAFLLVTGVCCYIFAKALPGAAADGDFLLFFLIAFTAPLYSAVLLLCATLTALRQKVRGRVPDNRESPGKQESTVPLVPFLYGFYLCSLLLF